MDRFLVSASLLFLAAASSGCATQAIIHGTTSIAMSPQAPGTGAALPQRALLCSHPTLTDIVYAQLDPGCVVRLNMMSTRYSSWTTATPVGACTLAGPDKPIELHVSTAAATVGGHLDITLGGADADGRWVTYRFVGDQGEKASDEQCERLILTVADDANTVWNPRHRRIHGSSPEASRMP